jgi:hypothetical protein
MHHCGRSISGANARGSFATSAWCAVGLILPFVTIVFLQGDGGKLMLLQPTVAVAVPR